MCEDGGEGEGVCFITVDSARVNIPSASYHQPYVPYLYANPLHTALFPILYLADTILVFA